MTDVDAAEVARIEHEYLRYRAARPDRRRRRRRRGAPARDRGVAVGGDRRPVDGRRGRGRGRRRGPERQRAPLVGAGGGGGGGGHRGLVEHADQRDGDAHPLRTHAQKADETEQRHREPTREPEPRYCAARHHKPSITDHRGNGIRTENEY